jgi:hypothetical protein
MKRLATAMILLLLAACQPVGTAPQNQPYPTGSRINPDL